MVDECELVPPQVWRDVRHRAPLARLWRKGSPSMLLLALLLFPLPWVEIRCNAEHPLLRSKAVLKQSGLQSAYGGFSPDAILEAAADEWKREQAVRFSPAEFARVKTEADRKKLAPSAVPLWSLIRCCLWQRSSPGSVSERGV